jgi:hypothetical protein
MNGQVTTQSRRIALYVAAFALLGALIFAPAMSADTTGSVTVTASVASELSYTLCDTDADFGDGLTSNGAAPQNTTDTVGVTTPSSQTGGSVYYHWTPSCQPIGEGVRFFHVHSSSSWKLTPCATENDGSGASPTLRIANSDLRWGANQPAAISSYANANITNAFALCSAVNPPSLTGLSGTLDIYGHYYLQIAPTDQPGTFATTTTWTLTPS